MDSTQKAKELMAIIKSSDDDDTLLLSIESFLLKIDRDSWKEGFESSTNITAKTIDFVHSKLQK